MSDEVGQGTDVEGPVLQAPLSARLPVSETDVAEAQPEGSGEPVTSTPGDAVIDQVPQIPGLDETTWTMLAPEDRERLMPVLKSVERGVSERMHGLSELQRKADLWESVLQVPEILEYLRAISRGEEPPSLTHPKTASAMSAGATDAEELSELTDDPQRLGRFIEQQVLEAVKAAVQPLQSQLQTSAQVLSQLVLENQKANIADGDRAFWDEALQIVARKNGAISVDEAIDMVRGKNSRMAPTQKVPAPASEADAQKRLVATISTPQAGPPASRLARKQSIGRISPEVVKESLRELGLEL